MPLPRPFRVLFVVPFLAIGTIAADSPAYVGAEGGLRMRTAPDVNAQVVSLIPNGSAVVLIRESGNTVTISGRSGKWSCIRYGKQEGWVFGGFLSTTQPINSPSSQPISGNWCFYLKPWTPLNPEPGTTFKPMWSHRFAFSTGGRCTLRYNQGEGFQNYTCSYTMTGNKVTVQGLDNASHARVVLDRRKDTLEFAESTGWDFYLNTQYVGIPCTD